MILTNLFETALKEGAHVMTAAADSGTPVASTFIKHASNAVAQMSETASQKGNAFVKDHLDDVLDEAVLRLGAEREVFLSRLQAILTKEREEMLSASKVIVDRAISAGYVIAASIGGSLLLSAVLTLFK